MFQNLKSKKYIRRTVLFFVLVAPLVYLFGALFCWLLGSHGSVDLPEVDLFAVFFSNDNFLVAIGQDVVNSSAVGFTPYADLITFIDTNMLNLSSNNIGLMAYGYVYYLLNAVTIYMVAVIVLKLVLLPLKVVDLFDRGSDL